MSTASANSPASRVVPAVKRVNVRPALGCDPAFITVHFSSVEAAQEGYDHLLEGLANDPRTKLELGVRYPTLTYPVI